MTLPTGQISMAQVNVELSQSSTALITLNDTAVRTLAGKASGAISMDDLRGKTAAKLSYTYVGVNESTDGGSITKTVNSVSFGTSTATKRIYILAAWTDQPGASWQINSATIGGISATMFPVLNFDAGGASVSGQMFAVEATNLTSGTVQMTFSGSTAFSTLSLFVFEVFNQKASLSTASNDAQNTALLITQTISDTVSVVTDGFVVAFFGFPAPISMSFGNVTGLRNGSPRNLGAKLMTTTDSAYAVSGTWVGNATAFLRLWSFKP